MEIQSLESTYREPRQRKRSHANFQIQIQTSNFEFKEEELSARSLKI